MTIFTSTKITDKIGQNTIVGLHTSKKESGFKFLLLVINFTGYY